MARRMTLRALARSRGYYMHGVERVPAPGLAGWYACANKLSHDDSVDVEAPTRHAAEAGLRAALEALPAKRKDGER